MALEIGAVLANKYRIERLLGEGGMGSVYLAVHLELERHFAVKTLRAESNSEEGIERFKREARAAGRIGNDHILEVFDIGLTDEGDHYLVMEYLRGEQLNARLARVGSLSEESFVHIALQLLDGLGAAHRAGIVHRDLKPENIFLLEKRAEIPDFIKIIDFGVSRFRGIDGKSGRLTETGIVLGTPYYLSPEQAGGRRDLDPRSDIHTAGTIFYECLAGRVPFQEAEDLQELVVAIMVREPPDLRAVAPGVDPELAAIVMRAMAKERGARYQTTDDFAEVLRSWAQSRGIGRSTVPPALGTPATVSPIANRQSQTTGQRLSVGAPPASSQPVAVGQPVADAPPIPVARPVEGARVTDRPAQLPDPQSTSGAQPAAATQPIPGIPPAGDGWATIAGEVANPIPVNTQRAWHRTGAARWPRESRSRRRPLLLTAALVLPLGAGVVGAVVVVLSASSGRNGVVSAEPASSAVRPPVERASGSPQGVHDQGAARARPSSALSVSSAPAAATSASTPPAPRPTPRTIPPRPAPNPGARTLSPSATQTRGSGQPAPPREPGPWDPY
ncbi:MAG: protein kinase [Polyangiaceae bacterium]|nr:protein kinase [Polyangiaceae bacterium]